MSTIKVTPHELKSLNTKCKTEAAAVAKVRATVGNAIHTTDWDSPAATKFKADWDTTYVKALTKLETALQDLGKAANTMAENYEKTEAAYKGG